MCRDYEIEIVYFEGLSLVIVFDIVLNNARMHIHSGSDIEKISIIIFRCLFCIWAQSHSTTKCYSWLSSFKVMFHSCLLLIRYAILLPIE
jgi:hypothetical protein